jgi:hypothetical protein
MTIFSPHDSHPFIGFDDEFKIGDILSAHPEISGLSIHSSIANCGFQIPELNPKSEIELSS